LDKVRRSQVLRQTNYPFLVYRFTLENLPPEDKDINKRYVEAKPFLANVKAPRLPFFPGSLIRFACFTLAAFCRNLHKERV
jgi:hypothetical protein